VSVPLCDSGARLIATGCAFLRCSFTARRMKIRLLEHNRDSTFETSIIERNVVKIIHHNRYNPNTFNNDIALLRLDKEVPIKGDLSPACMPLPGNIPKTHKIMLKFHLVNILNESISRSPSKNI
jgi:Trypsin